MPTATAGRSSSSPAVGRAQWITSATGCSTAQRLADGEAVGRAELADALGRHRTMETAYRARVDEGTEGLATAAATAAAYQHRADRRAASMARSPRDHRAIVAARRRRRRDRRAGVTSRCAATTCPTRPSARMSPTSGCRGHRRAGARGCARVGDRQAPGGDAHVGAGRRRSPTSRHRRRVAARGRGIGADALSDHLATPCRWTRWSIAACAAWSPGSPHTIESATNLESYAGGPERRCAAT